MGIIEVKGLAKDFKVAKKDKGKITDYIYKGYEHKRAVDDISFSIEKGQIVGYIGPNGAGKSTTIKMLTGILVPTAGEISVNGLVPYKKRKEHAKNIGVVFGQRTQLWWELPVNDSLNLLKHIYRVPDQLYKKNLELFSDVLGIGEFIHKPVRQLSLGQRMRADFAASLLHSPGVVFLDEPTIGLDIVVKGKIREFIETINRENGVTVIITTHDIGDIERLCKRTIVIDNGKVIYDGNVEDMKDRFGKYRTLIIEINGEFNDFQIENAVVENREDKKIWIKFDKDLLTPSQIIAELMKKHDIKDLTVQEPQIEGVIKSIYEGKYR